MSKSKEFTDYLYGTHHITEPVLIDLIDSPEIQRLKGINQLGLPDNLLKVKGFSRYEHSIGVMLLLRKFNAPLEEQVAGLLHDVNHRAFSHLYEWLHGQQYDQNNPQNLQDKTLTDFLQNSRLSRILNKHHFNAEQIADHHRYPLLEQVAPKLCADRIDYSLREFPETTARHLVDSLTITEGRFVCRDRFSARLFAESYLSRQRNNWGSENNAVRYELFVRGLQRAIGLGLITETDFSDDDDTVLSKMTSIADDTITNVLGLLNQQVIDLPILNKQVHVKFRRVDPEYNSNNQLIPISQVEPDIAVALELEKQRCQNGLIV